MRDLFRYQKLTLGWALFVLVMCNMNMGSVAHSPRFFPGFDKLVHCGFFFMFTALYSYGMILQRGNFTILIAVKAFVVSVTFGALIEVLQLYIFTWRSGEWGDLFADSVGTGMAAFCALITTAALHKKER